MSDAPRTATCLWFDTGAEPAAQLYVSLLSGSRIDEVNRKPDGAALTVAFTLGGAPFVALNGGPRFRLSPAVSVVARCADQAEIDRLWAALTAEGGAEGRCGWLTDRFGLSWQVVPDDLGALLFSGDAEADARAFAVMMTMTKLHRSALDAARRPV